MCHAIPLAGGLVHGLRYVRTGEVHVLAAVDEDCSHLLHRIRSVVLAGNQDTHLWIRSIAQHVSIYDIKLFTAIAEPW